MNMFKPVAAKTIEEYMAALPQERKEPILFLHQFIQKNAPTLKPNFITNMLGYGLFPYKGRKKEDLVWPVVSLASHKNYISIYVCAVENGTYVAEAAKDRLGKVSVGKSCIRFKKIEDLNLAVLKEVLKKAEKQPGFSM